MKLITWLSFIVFFGLTSCKKIQPQFPQPVNPCDCQKPVSADFVIGESFEVVNGEWVFIPTDTTLHSRSVNFRTIDEADEYKWNIGFGTYNTRNVNLFFDEQNMNSTISVTCVVRKTPNTYCFPNDDGYDSIVKTFRVSQYPQIIGDYVYLGTEGTYRVAEIGSTDSIDIIVSYKDFEGLYKYIQLINFDGEGGVALDEGREVEMFTYRKMKFKAKNNFEYTKSISGSIHNQLLAKSILNFKSAYIETPGQPPIIKEWSYEGRKLN